MENYFLYRKLFSDYSSFYAFFLYLLATVRGQVNYISSAGIFSFVQFTLILIFHGVLNIYFKILSFRSVVQGVGGMTMSSEEDKKPMCRQVHLSMPALSSRKKW